MTDDPQQKQRDLIAYLSQFITPNKQQLMDDALAMRTRHIAVALEDVVKPFNAAAVMRSCDCFGVQDLYTIQNHKDYYFSGNVTQGAQRWVTEHPYNDPSGNNAATCFATLRQQGYRIVATSLRPGSTPIHDLDISQPVALVFGTEQTGISDATHDEADEWAMIPMFGFTQSFNISVSVAICLYDLTTRLHASDITWQLDEAEKLSLKIEWMKSRLQGGDALVRQFYEDGDRG
jgi:tRNA (guanosine-2'-O-)-methyltransferase